MTVRLKQKLKSNGGVSILLALVGFLVASMISAVIVTAALNAAEGVADDRKVNQAHLTLESAAQLVRDEMENTVFTYQVSEADGSLTPGCSGTFSEKIKEAVIFVDSDIQTGDYESSGKNSNFTISLLDESGNSLDEGNEEVGDVDVSFIMKGSDDEKYDLYFTLSTGDSTGTEQTLYLYMNGIRKEQTSDTEEIIWKGISISQVSQEN